MQRIPCIHKSISQDSSNPLSLSVPEILGGMLDLDPRFWRNPKRERFEEQKSKVLAFGARWKEVDFTKKKKSREESSSSSSESSSSESE